jgi:hypothetical protein
MTDETPIVPEDEPETPELEVPDNDEDVEEEEGTKDNEIPAEAL